MSSEPVLITGIGVVSSIGIGQDEFFDALLKKKSGIRSLCGLPSEIGFPDGSDVSRIPPGLLIGAPVVDFVGKQHVKPRKALKVMCREIQTTFAAAQLAIDSAGLRDHLPAGDLATLSADQIGTVFGSEMFVGSPTEMEDAVVGCRDESGNYDAAKFGVMAMKKVLPLWMLKYLPNMPACHVGISLEAQGPNNSLVLGEVSGPAAAMEGISCLDRKLAKVMLTGAAGTRVNPTRLNYRGGSPVPEVIEPTEFSSRPHAPDATGVVGGEAAVCVVLESLANADQRDASAMAKIDAVVSRFVPSKRLAGRCDSECSDGRGSTESIRLAIDGALGKAGISPTQVGAIVSQATGEVSIDHAEATAIARTLPNVPVTAPIAAFGHTGAATGGMNLAVGAMMVARGQIPPTLWASESLSGTAQTRHNIGLVAEPTPLQQPYVVCLSHTPEGSAMATVLSPPPA